MFELLKKLSSDRLVIIVTHDLESAKIYGDRVISMKDGEVISDSSPQESDSNTHSNKVFKHHHLSLSNSFKLACWSMKKRLPRLILTMLLSTIAFSVFGVVHSFTSWNKTDALLSTIKESGIKDVTLKAEANGYFLFDSEFSSKIKKDWGDKIFLKEVTGLDYSHDIIAKSEKVDGGKLNEGVSNSNDIRIYDDLNISGYVHFSEEDLSASGFGVIGRLPQNDNEIAVSKVSYRTLKKQYGLRTFEGVTCTLDLCGEGEQKYNVVGVVDNNFNFNAYDGYTNEDLSNDMALTSNLKSDLQNSFSNVVYVNDKTFEKITSTSSGNIEYSYVMDGGATINNSFSVNEVSVIDDLYQDYIVKQEELWYRERKNYFSYDPENHKAYLNYYWFIDNGYTQVGNLSKYEKTISDPEGDYVVTYEYVLEKGEIVRTSEESDPNLSIPEKAEVSISKKEFLEKQFVFRNGANVDSLLDESGNFKMLDEGAIIQISDKNDEMYKAFSKGQSFLPILGNYQDMGIKNIFAAFLSNESETNEPFTDLKLIVNESEKSYFDLKNKGYWKILAILSNSEKTNREFFDYCQKENMNGFKIAVINRAYDAISEVCFFNEVYSKLFLIGAGILALFSSFILTNFISVSMHYERRTIGILKELGASNGSILGIFAYEAVFIALINTVVSSITALISCLILNARITGLIRMSIGILNISVLQPLLILAFSVLSSCIGVSWPIIKNVRRKPIDLMKD